MTNYLIFKIEINRPGGSAAGNNRLGGWEQTARLPGGPAARRLGARLGWPGGPATPLVDCILMLHSAFYALSHRDLGAHTHHGVHGGPLIS